MDSARHTEKLWEQTKTAHHHPWHPRCFAPHVALTRPPLSRFALHFARLSGYLDSGFIVRISVPSAGTLQATVLAGQQTPGAEATAR